MADPIGDLDFCDEPVLILQLESCQSEDIEGWI